MAPARETTPFIHVAVLGLGLAACPPAYATHPPELPGHDEVAERELHQPKHGGGFGDADDLYHYEVVRQPDRHLRLYVSDDENTPIDTRTVQGRWTVNPEAPTPLTGTFVPAADGAYFIAELPTATGAPLHIKVEVLKETQWVGMEFYL